MDEPTLAPVEMELMALGAALVGCRRELNGEHAARVVARAMDHIAQLRKQLAKGTEPKARKQR
jgi:hypothetical protein